jgi:hypothetical protein
LACFSPATVRSRINARSNSATAPSMQHQTPRRARRVDRVRQEFKMRPALGVDLL